MPIDAALTSNNPLIQGLAILDARTGKQRLARFTKKELHPLCKALLEIRLTEDGRSKPTLSEYYRYCQKIRNELALPYVPTEDVSAMIEMKAHEFDVLLVDKLIRFQNWHEAFTLINQLLELPHLSKDNQNRFLIRLSRIYIGLSDTFHGATIIHKVFSNFEEIV